MAGSIDTPETNAQPSLNGHILVVDDAIENRQLLGALLSKHNYHVVFADNGLVALEVAKNTLPDLILLDILMPFMDGYEVCQRLRSDPELSKVPIIMMTALNDSLSRKKGLAAGADEFLSKPFDVTELLIRIRNITQLNRFKSLLESQEKLARLANYDPVTQLPNRILLADRLGQSIAWAQRMKVKFPVFFLKLYDYRETAQSLGREDSEIFIRHIGNRLRQSLRHVDTLAHLGRDEFVISYPPMSNVEQFDIDQRAKRLFSNLKSPLVFGDRDIPPSANIGITLYPDDGTTADVLVSHAEIAADNAEQSGANQYRYYTPKMNAALNERIQLDNRLSYAMERDEFSLVYQPQIDMTSRQIVSAEVLLRWKCPNCSPVSPIDFIPLAEQSGLIIPLGDWIIRTAFDQLRQWRDAGLSLPRLAINLSSKQIHARGFVTRIARYLEKYAIPAESIELEITESLLLDKSFDQEIPVKIIMDQLKDIGFSMAIDDFGTGYSSLSYLHQFPFDRVKIDKSFIDKIPHDRTGTALVNAILGIANSLDLEVIAEGIELPEQDDYLRVNHCTIGQGYLYGRPLIADNFYQLFSASR